MELKAYITPLKKWWWLIGAAALLAGLSSFLAVRQQPLIYQSRATLMIGQTIADPNPTNTQFTLGQQLAQTYADIGRRQPVREATRQALGLSRLPEYTVRALPNTQLIEIVVFDTIPERSQAVASELANQLIHLSPAGPQQEEQERQEFIIRQLNELQAQIEATQLEIAGRQEELGVLFSARQIADVQEQIRALESKLNTLQANYAALLATTQQGAINALSVIEPAYVPASPVDPNRGMTVLAAAAVGFVLAAAAAYLLEYLDDTIRTPESAAKLCDVPVLATIARIRSRHDENKLVTHSEPRSPVSEAFRGLRTSIQFAAANKPGQTILVTSSNPAEGKSVVTANLAIVFAQAGYRVLLVDADLRRPVQHILFERSLQPGLADLLQLSASTPGTPLATTQNELLDACIQPTAQSGLSLLTGGVIPSKPSEMLGPMRMKRVLSEVVTRYDYVILDSPPVLMVTDAVVLSTQVDSAVLVIEARRTRRQQLQYTMERLREVNGPVIGTVLNRFDLSRDRYGYYGYDLADLEKAVNSRAEPDFAGNGNDPIRRGQPNQETS